MRTPLRTFHRRPHWALAAVVTLGLLSSLAAAQAACSVDSDCGAPSVCRPTRCLDGACVTTESDLCDDENACTSDECIEETFDDRVVVQCLWRTVPTGTICSDATTCAGEGICQGTTCQPGEPAAAGTPCNDDTVCNGSEACDGAGTCAAGAPLPCTADLCSIPFCDPVSGCTSTPRPAGTSCPDGDVCNGNETCDGAGHCEAGTVVPVCTGGNACSDAYCDPLAGCRLDPKPSGTPCGDSNVCNGVEECDGRGGCAATPPTPCEDPGACVSAVCDPTLGCVVDDAPATGCTEAGSGSLLIDERLPGKEKLRVRLAESGPPYGQIEWGDPTGTSGVSYELCVFDQNGDLAGGFEIDRGDDVCGGKPCWTSVAGSPPGGRRFMYRDPERSAAGVARILLRSARERGHQAITTLEAGNDVKHGYTTLPLGIAAALAGDTSATVQLSGSDGSCLEGALVGTGAGARFRGKVD